jgi:hypothetical protein
LSKQELEKELEEPVELDENELEKYIEFVVKEVRKKDRSTLNNRTLQSIVTCTAYSKLIFCSSYYTTNQRLGFLATLILTLFF